MPTFSLSSGCKSQINMPNYFRAPKVKISVGSTLLNNRNANIFSYPLRLFQSLNLSKQSLKLTHVSLLHHVGNLETASTSQGEYMK